MRNHSDIEIVLWKAHIEVYVTTDEYDIPVLNEVGAEKFKIALTDQ